MLLGKPSKVFTFCSTANVAKTVVADLMSVAQVADDEAPTRDPIWAFMSISYGWIAHADIHTEPLRYPLPPSSLTSRFMGDVRFTAGIIWHMIIKSKFASSFAVHAPLSESDEQDQRAARVEVKAAVADYYNQEYITQDPNHAVIEPVVSGGLHPLVGTKRPGNYWQQRSSRDMHSFYAGKVLFLWGKAEY